MIYLGIYLGLSHIFWSPRLGVTETGLSNTVQTIEESCKQDLERLRGMLEQMGRPDLTLDPSIS